MFDACHGVTVEIDYHNSGEYRRKQLKGLIKAFVRARARGDHEKRKDVGFQIIPLIRKMDVSPEEIRKIFKEVEARY